MCARVCHACIEISLTFGMMIGMNIMILSRKPGVFIKTSPPFAMACNHNSAQMEISWNEAVNCDKPILLTSWTL